MSGSAPDLIAGYLDGSLDAEAAGALAQLIGSDLDARRQLIETARLHRQLLAELRPVDLSAQVRAELLRDGERYVERVMGEVRAQQGRGPAALPAPRRWRPWLVPLALAAAIAIAGGALLWTWPMQPPVAPAAVIDARTLGTLRLVAAGDERRLPPGSALPDDDEILAEGAGAGIAYGDGTRVMLAERTQLRLGRSAAGGKRIRLDHGELTATVAKQPVGRPLLIANERMLATVVGTSFTIRADWDASIAVADGVVHVRDSRGGAEFDVAAGQSLLVRRNDRPLLAQATVWSLAGQLPRVVTAGLPLRGSTAADTVVGSVAYRPLQVNPYFAPGQYICVQSGKLIDHERQLFALPAAFRLHLCVRSARAGTARLTMQPPPQERGVTPNHGSTAFPVDGHWRDISLGAEDFTAASAPQTLVAGYPIACVSLWGFDCGALELSSFTLETAGP